MKKWTYLLSGVIIGAVVVTSGSAFADQISSLVGKKVTAEYTVVVDGQTLTDKGAAIDGRANVPVRGISQALGADIKVEGKTITVTTKQEGTSSAGGSATTKPATENKYIGMSKGDLEKTRNSLTNEILAPTEKERKQILAKIEELEQSGAPRGEGTSLTAKEEQLADYDKEIAKYTKELELVEEALAAQNK
ncbi:stalk domain-containing protein [Paenibacillus apiarius]|uniref:stalk domain-containing protein n=1 Tax=Paenibacillus apiarius TaxID=46240 RepID=UPI003B3A5181